MRLLLGTPAGRALIVLLGVIALATAVGVAVLWPSGESERGASGLTINSIGAEVARVDSEPCPSSPDVACTTIGALPFEGPRKGQELTIPIGTIGLDPELDVGDEIRLSVNPGPPGTAPSYSLSDFERRDPMLWLALAFAALVIVFGRLRGALSLIGLTGSLAVVLLFIVPAIRDGEPALAVALVGSLAVMLVTISLAHGLGVKSLAAMLGTAASLLLVVALAATFTELTHLTGFSSEEATILAASGSGISVQGLLLAGIVVGALGVLDDVTISQSSTVMALRAANPALSTWDLYGRAIEVGRDHISATVNTLVLAYVGAALPVLLIFSSGDTAFSEAINSEVVAKEIVAMLAGSIGLIAAVPVTTGLAAFLAARLPEDVIEADAGHGHVH